LLELVNGGDQNLPATEQVVERFDMVQEIDAWKVEAPVWGVAVPTWLDSEQNAPMVQAAAGRHERVIRFTRPGVYDTSRFDRVRVVASVDGGGGTAILLQLRRGTTVIEGIDAARFDKRQELLVLEIPLPREELGGEPFESLVLICPGAKRTVAIREVSLVSVPPAATLPAATEAPELVRIGHEARRAVGLLVGRELSVTAAVPPGARLDLSYGRPSQAWTPGTLELSLRLVDSGGELLERRWTLAELDPSAWKTESLDLSGLAGKQVTFQFALLGPEGAGLALTPPVLAVAAATAPTVLLITSDTHRADHIGWAAEDAPVHTPVLDALARRGTVFLDCFAPVNNTNPSHVALLTGTHPRDTGVLDNYRSISGAAETLAERFSEAGWATLAAISTKHLGPDGSGLGQGFDRVSWPFRQGHRLSTEALDDVLGWLPDVQGRPAFIWLHVFDPHSPYEPSEQHLQRYYDPGLDPRADSWPDSGVPESALPLELRGIRDLTYPVAMYRAEITSQDEQLERLLSVPRVARGVTALVSDHGESLGENGAWFIHTGVYTSTLHIPMVLAGPGVPAGVRETRPVQHLDLGRTLLDLAGLDAAGFPGRNLFAATLGPAPRFAIEANALSAAVTMEGLHLVLHLTERDLPNLLEQREAHELELFDLTRDARCAHDISNERPREAARLRMRLLEWLSLATPTGWAEDGMADQATLDALAQLGYVAPAGDGASGAFWTPDECEHCRRWEAVPLR
jgi:arylsulfatase A-like enzyme